MLYVSLPRVRHIEYVPATLHLAQNAKTAPLAESYLKRAKSCPVIQYLWDKKSPDAAASAVLINVFRLYTDE